MGAGAAGHPRLPPIVPGPPAAFKEIHQKRQEIWSIWRELKAAQQLADIREALEIRDYRLGSAGPRA